MIPADLFIISTIESDLILLLTSTIVIYISSNSWSNICLQNLCCWCRWHLPMSYSRVDLRDSLLMHFYSEIEVFHTGTNHQLLVVIYCNSSQIKTYMIWALSIPFFHSHQMSLEGSGRVAQRAKWHKHDYFTHTANITRKLLRFRLFWHHHAHVHSKTQRGH